jgi:hypothetical protein
MGATTLFQTGRPISRVGDIHCEAFLAKYDDLRGIKMDRHRVVRVIRSWDDCITHIWRGPTFVEVPGEWAHAVYSLVKISGEYRQHGLIVTNVGPDSQAAKAGIARGDVLLRYDGVELEGAGMLRQLAKHHTQGISASKTIVIEAARSSKDVSFEVQGGRLGITVSPSLYRFKPIRLPRRKRQGTKGARDLGAIVRIDSPLVHRPDDARRRNPGNPAIVEVPGELAMTVLFLAKALKAPNTSKLKRSVRALLYAAAPKPDRP